MYMAFLWTHLQQQLSKIGPNAKLQNWKRCSIQTHVLKDVYDAKCVLQWSLFATTDMIQHHVNANLIIDKSNFPALFFLKCICQLYIMQFLTCDLTCLQWMAKICCNTRKKLSINSNRFKSTPVIRIFFQWFDQQLSSWIYSMD